MKLNKTLALAAVVVSSLFAGGIAAQAQENTNTPPAGAPAPGMRGRPNMEKIATELGLSDDQKAKLKTVMTNQQAKVRALREDTTLSQEDKRAKLKEIRTDAQTQIKEILTEEQFTKWQTMMKRNRPAGGGARRLQADLVDPHPAPLGQ